MDKETKLQKLRSLIEEYVQYLDGYSEVTMEVIIKDNILQEIKKVVIQYGEEKEIVDKVIEVKIPLSEFVKITYHKPKLDNIYLFKSIEFPIENVNKRIEHYRNKIANCKLKLECVK